MQFVTTLLEQLNPEGSWTELQDFITFPLLALSVIYTSIQELCEKIETSLMSVG